MQDAGMIKISRIGTSVKGHKMNYYCATNQSMLITPPERKMHSLFASLKKISRFAAIGMAGLVSWTIVKPDDSPQLQVDSQENPNVRMEITDEDGKNDEDDKWSAAHQDFADESKQITEMQKDSPYEAVIPTASEPIPEPQPEPEPEPQPESKIDSESSGIDQAISQFAESERANTGAVSLDRTVYPVPYETAASTDAIDPLLLSIIIPIGVIIAGIILERLLARRARNKINQIT